MMGDGLRIGRVFGIDISIDASWLIIAFLVGWSFFAQFQFVFPELATGTLVLLAAVSAVAFFVSVLIHEISHSVMARSLDIPVGGITLFLFGGVTRTRLEAESAGDEFKVAIVGPLTSLAIAVVLWGVVELVPLPAPIDYAAGYLGWLNLALAVFNLLPGFPLDGGRVFRAIAWKITGSIDRATRLAATGGKVVAGILIALGILQVFGGNLGGLWLAAIGWFLYTAAAASGEQQMVRRALEGVTAEELMSRQPISVDADTRLDEAVDFYFLRQDHSTFPVVDDGEAIGLLTLRKVKEIPREDWATLRVRDVAIPRERLCLVRPDQPMNEVLDAMQEDETDRVLVMEGDTVVGIISPRDIQRWVRRTQELGLPTSRVRS